ncbi:MAG: ABC transporter substrate-binding protein [Burkholderiales bacterium]|nr:ABC transporter substrate-binding protein [Burkholderiales bacterium]
MSRVCISLIFLSLVFSVNAAYADDIESPVLSESVVTIAKSEVTVTAASCEADSPCRVVSDTSKKVLDAVNKGVPQNQTVSLINTIAAPQFEFTLMTKYALGNNWKLATAEQQQQLVELFKQLLIYTYSTALSKFKGAQINITSSTIDGKKAQVMSLVVMPSTTSNNNQPIKVEYDLARLSSSSGWKAYDIKIENASLVTTYRNQFNEIVQTSKIDGLIKQLQTKVTSLKEKNS